MVDKITLIITILWLFAFFHRGSKLSMLLQDSLGHVNCHTTVLAQVNESLAHIQETLSTIQLASRIRRTQRRTKVLVWTFQTAIVFCSDTSTVC